MDEYIEREAAEKVAEKYGCTNGSALGIHSGLADCISHNIAKLPAADVAPVRHGRWEWRGPCHDNNGKYWATCNACKKRQRLGDYERFCPNCGCKMDLEE